MDFGSLSSLSFSDSECEHHFNTKTRIVRIQVSRPVEILNFNAAWTIEPDKRLNVRYEERCTQTDFAVQEFCENGIQVDEPAKEDFACSVDLCIPRNNVEYEESAVERMLQHISLDIHRKEVKLSKTAPTVGDFALKGTGNESIMRAKQSSLISDKI